MFVKTTNIDALIALSERLFVDQSIPFCFPVGNVRLWTDPVEGEGAWFEIGSNLPREFRTYQNGAWVPDPARVDNG